MVWKKEENTPSLPEAYATVEVPRRGGFWKKIGVFIGPGLLVAVGYMDPGNWATDIAGGSQFGYTLLSVILVSNLFAMVLQHLSLKLGIATGLDLAQACRQAYSRPVNIALWILCEVAIAACDLAEVLGAAIALHLLFGLPLAVGVVVTALDVLLLLYFQSKGFRMLEAIVGVLILTIFLCFGYEILLSKPQFSAIVSGFLPSQDILLNPQMLYVAIGILGATVMPHNLYLHSSIVQTRNFEKTEAGKRSAIRYATLDSTVSLLLAFFINAAILIVAAATFHFSGYQGVADIHDAHALLDPLLGSRWAGICFAVALLAAGQNATLTGTLAGQIVMEGFLNLRIVPWLRRLITRLIAIVPALVVTLLYGEAGTGQLLVLSQVILSLQLSFAVVPLVQFTSQKSKMGTFTNSLWLRAVAWSITAIIMGLNGYLLWRTFF
jgi:manganese transport protein